LRWLDWDLQSHQRLFGKKSLVCPILFTLLTSDHTSVFNIVYFRLYIFRLVVIRTVAGVGLGGTIPSTNTLIAEVSPDGSRAAIMLLIGVGFTVGECVTALESMALDVGIGENWRWLMALSALPAIVSLILSLFFLDESPRFLYAAGRRREAKMLLR
jgi:putative MFS transporter